MNTIKMNNKIRQVIRKVLNAASSTPDFFNFSDAERLNWMIAQAYILGQLSAARFALKQQRRNSAANEEEAP